MIATKKSAARQSMTIYILVLMAIMAAPCLAQRSSSRSNDGLELLDFTVTPTTLSVGGEITVKFDIKNNTGARVLFGKYGVLVGCRDPQNGNQDFGHHFQNYNLQAGKTAHFTARKKLDQPGTWKIWPAYYLDSWGRWPISKTITVTSQPTTPPGRLELLNFSATPNTLSVGDELTVRFDIKNNTGARVLFGKYGVLVGCRDPQNGNQDFGHHFQDYNLQAGKTAHFTATKKLDQPGTWKIWPAYYLDSWGRWPISKTITVTSQPTTPPGRLELLNFSATPNTLSVGDELTVRFDIKNNTGARVLFGRYGVFVGCRDPQNGNQDFGHHFQNYNLQAGKTAHFTARKKLDQPGTWKIWPAYFLNRWDRWTTTKTITVTRQPMPPPNPGSLELLNFTATPSTLRAGDELTVRFDLKNNTGSRMSFGRHVVLIVCRDPQNRNQDFGHNFRSYNLPAGETAHFTATKKLDQPGTWKIWPAYYLDPGAGNRIVWGKWTEDNIRINVTERPTETWEVLLGQLKLHDIEEHGREVGDSHNVASIFYPSDKSLRIHAHAFADKALPGSETDTAESIAAIGVPIEVINGSYTKTMKNADIMVNCGYLGLANGTETSLLVDKNEVKWLVSIDVGIKEGDTSDFTKPIREERIYAKSRGWSISSISNLMGDTAINVILKQASTGAAITPELLPIVQAIQGLITIGDEYSPDAIPSWSGSVTFKGLKLETNKKYMVYIKVRVKAKAKAHGLLGLSTAYSCVNFNIFHSHERGFDDSAIDDYYGIYLWEVDVRLY